MIQSCTEDALRLWDPDDEISKIADDLQCSRLAASLLWMRGAAHDDVADIKAKWLSPELDHWLDKLDLGPGSSKASALWRSLSDKSTVVVYGDYDVDGIAATTFMMDLALKINARVRYYIPRRDDQGYGFHPDVVEMIARSGMRCDMLVVVDCGTQNIDAAARAKQYGIPVIIFDHHLAREDLADAPALVNPQVDGNDLARKLCAAGVVWCWAWKNELAEREWLLRSLDVVALATIADCVSMSSPVNRMMARTGIASMKAYPRAGLSALMHGLDLDRSSIDSDVLAMKIIPCLNAAGRLELADHSMKIFFPSGNVADHANKLVELNKRRRDLSARMIGDVEREVSCGAKYRHVLFSEDWPPGVLSSVASHVCSSMDTPVVLASPAQKDMIRGTLRVPRGVDAEAILSSMSDMLVSWGGHRMAAGFSVRRDDWNYVRDSLEDALTNAKVQDELDDVLVWDPTLLDLDMWRDAESLGPFGVGNPYPRLFCRNSGNIDTKPLGRKGGHIKIIVDGCELLAFGGEHLKDEKHFSGFIYKPRVNYWRSSENLQFVVDKAVIHAG